MMNSALLRGHTEGKLFVIITVTIIIIISIKSLNREDDFESHI